MDWERVSAADFCPGGRYFAGLVIDEDPTLSPLHAKLAKPVPAPDGGAAWWPDPNRPDEPPPWSSRWASWVGLSGSGPKADR